MSEQKVVQHRRDVYSNYTAQKLKPGEIVMITSGDPNSSSGKGVYACIAAGDVVQLATRDELNTYDQSAQAAATDAAQSKADTIGLKEQVDEELTGAQTAAQAAQGAQADVLQMKTQVETALSTAQSAAQSAQEALQSVLEKEAQIDAIIVQNTHTMALGGGSTDSNGICYVYLSEDFIDELDGGSAYRVFLQEEGEGEVYVGEKTNTFFTVSGTEGLAFSYMAVI